MRKSVLFILLCGLLAAGCRGSGPGGPETRPTPISAPASEGGGSPDEGGGVGQAVALRLWFQQSDTFQTAYQTLADAYTAANPGVTITLESFDVSTYGQTIQQSLTEGTAADIIQMPGGTLCVYNTALAPAPPPVIALNPQDAFDPLLLGGFLCDGMLYGLPQETSVPWGLAVAGSSAAVDVAWDFIRFATLDPTNAAQWNTTTGTPGAITN